MATLIRLQRPVASPETRAPRPRMFPGRSLGEDELDRLAAHAGSRLDALMAGAQPGIVHGLTIAAEERGPDGVPGVITIRPGLAIRGDGRVITVAQPLRVLWADLLARLDETPADGLYLLTLDQALIEIDRGPAPEPCRRDEADPLRDQRHETLAVLGLSERLRELPADAETERLDRFMNLACAVFLERPVFEATGGAVPLAMVALREGQPLPNGLREAAGRWVAAPDAAKLMLASQVDDAFVRAEQRHGARVGERQELLRLLFEFLPAAGRLPATFLLEPATTTPRCPFFPPHFRLDMTVMPVSAVDAVVMRDLRRRPLRLGARHRDGVRLLLAVDDRDYRPDLLDLPAPDTALADALFEAYVDALRTHFAWHSVHDDIFNRLSAADDATRRFFFALDRAAGDDPAFITWLTKTRGKTLSDFVDAATDAASFATWVEAEGLTADLDGMIPDEASFAKLMAARGFTLEDPAKEPASPDPALDWMRERNALPEGRATLDEWSEATGRAVPTRADSGDAPGVLTELAALSLRLPVLQRLAEEARASRDSRRSFLDVQRQHLDAITASLSSLAGGVPPDGSGLRIARLLPYLDIQPPAAGSGDDGDRTDASVSVSRTAQPQAAATFGVGSLSAGTFTQFRDPGVVAGGSLAAGEFLSPSSGIPMIGERIDYAALAIGQGTTPIGNVQFEVETKDYGVARHIQGAKDANNEAIAGFTGLRGEMEARFGVEGRATTFEPDVEEPAAYANLVKVSRDLLADIGVIQTEALRRERNYLRRAKEIREHTARITELNRRLVEARAKLRAENADRLEEAGDYAAAQRLVLEDRARVEREEAERTRILTNLRGLYYIRHRAPLLSTALPDPLELRHRAADDLVPGCGADESGPLPDSLDEFMEALLDLPVSAYRRLQGLHVFLPQLPQLRTLVQAREITLQARIRATPAASNTADGASVAGRLVPLRLQNRAALQTFATARVAFSSSLVESQKRATTVLSVADVLGGRPSLLRTRAEHLRGDLEMAGRCLLRFLRGLPPSLRFAWAELAEDDRLPIEAPERWPSLERAEDEAFNTVRSLVELIGWLLRQLDDQADAAARTAVRNLVRAALLVAAYGDPGEVLTGRVEAAPARLRVGEMVRLTLERTALVGTRLHLLDERQEVVGLLRIEDDDQRGAVASVVQVLKSDAEVRAGFRVSSLTHGHGR